MNNKIKEFWDDLFAKNVDYKEISYGVLDKLFVAKKDVASFLDLGCGTGSLMRIMEHKGIKSEGVEWSSEAIKLAQERGTVGKIYNHDLDNIEDLEVSEKYDVICIKLVLAFITNKSTLLNWCKDHLNQDGILIINTPVSTKAIPSLKPAIAIKDLEVKNLISSVFDNVELIEEENAQVGVVQTYFCK